MKRMIVGMVTLLSTILSAYPKSDYADDATAAIEHLGKTDDEVVKGFLNGK